MVYEDIIIGAGLASLATAMGLQRSRQVLVITGGQEDDITQYDSSSGIPCQNEAIGGLGNYWHGVIPMHSNLLTSHASAEVFKDFFSRFYPRENIEDKVGKPLLFVPLKPIRPKQHWLKVENEFSGRLTFMHTRVSRISRSTLSRWEVHLNNGKSFETQRLWLAAGALGTPCILEKSKGFEKVVRDTASDHLILYAGQVNLKLNSDVQAPRVQRTPSGYWISEADEFVADALVTKKPAHFSYKRLDYGIEQRSAFGLPTYGVIKKILTAGSVGFVAESLFNKFGLFPNSSMLSVYAQVRVKDGYTRLPNKKELEANADKISSRIELFRQEMADAPITLSCRPDLYVKGIHLHRTLREEVLPEVGINCDEGSCFVVDASSVDDIGSEHHSFRLMLNAYLKARSIK